MRSVPARNNSRRLVVGIAISILAHLILFGLLFFLAPDLPVQPKSDKVALKIVDRTTKSEFEAAPMISGERPRMPSEKLDGQVVSLPEPAVQQVPEDAKFLSKYDIKVDREQVAPRRPGKPGRPGEKAERPRSARQTGIVAAGEKAPDSSDTQADQSARGQARDETSKPTLPSLKGLGNMLLPGGAAGGRGSGMNMRMLADQVVADGTFADGKGGLASPGGGGEGGSDDVFMGVEDEGDETLVNSRSFKYWDFFERVKDQVRSEWDPGPVYRARDPDGNAFGKRDRYTILGISLDGNGAVAQLEVIHKSGLDFLDEEAVRAFQAAGPFPNPPAGLIDDRGRILFRFGFLLEFGSQTGSFFWQRP